jgi:trans-aconitate methyltransferase
MLAQAREMTRGDEIDYRCADLQTLTLPANSCDLVYSSLALHYLPDIAPLFATLQQALVPAAPGLFRRTSHLYRPAAGLAGE